MKKIFAFLALAALSVSCYEPYVKDYDYSAGYFAFQYDYRTFVVDESEEMNIYVVLAGVLENDMDRAFNVTLDNSLLNGNLGEFFGGTYCTALNGFKAVSGSYPGDYAGGSSSYITSAFTSVSSLTPLPESHYTLGGSDNMIIEKGSHTAKRPITMCPDMASDPNAYKPCYALGFRINSADVDTLLQSKRFCVIA